MNEKLASQGDWYCRNCGYIDCSRVTFSETCDKCHQPVEWHTNEQQAKIDTIRNDTIEECVGWLSDKIEHGELDPLWLRDNMSIALKDEL